MVLMFLGRKVPQIAALFTVFILFFTPADSRAGTMPQPNGLPFMQTAAPSGVVVIKITSGAEEVKRNAPNHLASVVQNLMPDAMVETRFPGLSKSLAASELSRYFQMKTQGLNRQSLLKLVAALNSDPQVEVAFLEPVAVPAMLGFDAFTGAVPELSSPGIFRTITETPDFEPDQGYLDAAPTGVGAWAMRDTSGSAGAGITVIDVEGGWLWSHEDLPAAAFELGTQIDDLAWRNHGTAVLSEIRGQDNGLGVTGIAPDCSVGCSAIGSTSTAAALAAAVDVLQRGDLILIELHAPGPNADGNGQFGYVPMEYWPDNFDIIRLATARGIIVCEAAGNGYQNLDGPEYMGLFDRSIRDSGAIMCGATEGSDLFSANFSNNGTRVDLNGWGWNVTAAGYGNLQSGDETEWYTNTFSGTSSASPIVTGSVASLQGMVMSSSGITLDARLARDILRETGTPMTGGNLIGTRPNLEAAFAHADTIIGGIQGIVTDDQSGLPLAGVTVQVAGNGSFTMTDATGWYQLPLVEGPVMLSFSSYLYHVTTANETISSSSINTHNQTLTALDRINIKGQVFGSSGPLAGVIVTPIDQPVGGDTSDPTGSFSINVPALYDYTLLFDGASGFGARVVVIGTEGVSSDIIIDPLMASTSENFSSDDGGFSSSFGLWSHGTPPAAVTGPAFDSGACWGVGMDGYYDDYASDNLTSPAYNLSGVTGNYYLSFHYFCATEAAFDGVNLEVFDGSEFILQTPLEGYTDPALSGLVGNPGWSGNSGRWHGTVFDISDFLSADFQFRLNFGSDGGVTENGFYIDAISFGSGGFAALVGVDDTPVVPALALKAWPNPFNPQVNLEYSLTKPGQLRVDVFDLRGSRVRTLLNAPVSETRGTLSWDGRLNNGQPASSGVYLVRMIGPDNQAVSERVVLAK